MKLLYCLFCLSLLTVSLTGCMDGPQEYLKKHDDDLLRVIPDARTLPADGKSSVKISAYIPGEADLKSVTFTTSDGTFRFSDTTTYTTEATADGDSLRADAYLISGTDVPEQVIVKVTASGITTALPMTFTQALADSIANESATASIKRGYGSEVVVKTTLSRKTGTPSERQTVSFSAIRDDKKSIGEFRAISPEGSDKYGVINSTFVLKDTLYTGPVKIISKYQGAKIYTDTLLIFVTYK